MVLYYNKLVFGNWLCIADEQKYFIYFTIVIKNICMYVWDKKRLGYPVWLLFKSCTDEKRASTLPQVENGFLVASAHIDSHTHPHSHAHTHTHYTHSHASVYVRWMDLFTQG